MSTEQVNNRQAASELANWIVDNEHLKGTPQFQQVADGLRQAQSLQVEEKYTDLFSRQATDTGAFSDFVTSFGLNTLEVGSGLSQLALQGASKLGIPGAEDLYNDFTREMSSYIAEEKKLTEDSPVASFAGDISSDIALLVASPIGKKEAPKKLYKKMLESGIELGLLEGVKLQDEDGNRLNTTAGAFTLGGLSRGAFEGVASAYNAIRGKGQERISTELDKLSKQFDVKTSVGDLTQSKPWQLTENLLDRVPFLGTGDFARKQGESLEQAANKIVNNYGIPEDEISNFLTGAVKKKYSKLKKISDANYDKVKKLMGGQGVSYNNTHEAVDAAINKLGANRELDEIQKLTTNLKKFLPKDYYGLDEAGNFINSGGRGVYAKSFDDAYEQLKQIGSLRHDAYKGNNEILRQVYDDIYKGIQRDIDELGTSLGGDAAEALNKAKSYYAKEIMPYQQGYFRKIRKPDEYPNFNSDNIYATFLKPNQKGTTQTKKLTDRIELDDLQMLKQQVLSDAHLAATKNDVFNPKVFANSLKNMAKARKVIFTKAENEQLDGFVKLSNLLPRAKLTSDQQAVPVGRVAQSIPGLTIGGAAFGTGFTAGASGGLAILGGIKGASLLLTSEAGRKLLTTINKNPNKAESLVPQLSKVILDETRRRVIPTISATRENRFDDEE